MSGNSDIERRTIPLALRANEDTRKIRGHAIVFDAKSVNLGGFREIIRPEAVDRTIREALDVRAYVDHDSSKIIGRTRAGTLMLRKESRGLFVEIDPPNTTAGNDILESIRRGDVSGMSFGFRVLEEDWRDEEGEPVRDVLDMVISEVSIVTNPAYPQTDVAVAMRSLERFQATGMSTDLAQKLHKTRLAR